jgi:uridine monophosphate synthetase
VKNFFDKLEAAIECHQSLLCVGLDPNPEMLPQSAAEREDSDNLIASLGAWLHDIITQTANLVCAYKPTLSFYTALGSQGMVLLEQTLKAIPAHIPVILDAKHSDLNTSTLFARTVFEQWQVDAVTLSPYAGQDQVAPFLVYPDKAVFVLCCTSNPSAVAVQGYPSATAPLYQQVVKEAKTWGTPAQVGLEVGTIVPEILAGVRAIAPERLILVRSIWQETVEFNRILSAGLNQYGTGLLIPVPQDLLSQQEITAPLTQLRDTINQSRTQIIQDNSTCDLWFSDVCTLAPHPHLDLILQLYDIGCILFGDFVQASGATFPYYIDLRKIISNPQIFHQILNAYEQILQILEFDRIAGIPYGSLPTATGLSLRLNRPMIFPRKEVKAHGTRRVIEGNFHPGETVVVVDDILISGQSAMEGAAKLESAGLKVKDIVVFLDHGQGVKARLSEHGYQGHAVLTLAEVAETLYHAGRIDDSKFQAFVSHN